MNGIDLSLMEHRFKQDGYHTSRFHYKSISHSPIQNATKLAEHIDSITTDQIHYVCHSLGGLILRHYLHMNSTNNTGRIVMLGTPNKTSSAAINLARFPGGSLLLGKSTENGLFGPLPDWDKDHKLGIIAGDFRFGMGTIIPDIPKPNDGTVSVEETCLTEMCDHITLHVSHFGLVLSKTAYQQTRYFIENAKFQHE